MNHDLWAFIIDLDGSVAGAGYQGLLNDLGTAFGLFLWVQVAVMVSGFVVWLMTGVSSVAGREVRRNRGKKGGV